MYMKKNMYLVAAIKRVHKLYEDEMQEVFVKFHRQVQTTARKHMYDRGTLSRSIKARMEYCMASLNPLPSWKLEQLEDEELSTLVTIDDLEDETPVTSFSQAFELELSTLP